MIETQTAWACVAGWPVAHSRSPLIYGYWLKSLGIAGRYDRAPVPPGSFNQFAATIGRDGLVGANVTIPHKESAFAACDRVSGAAADLGAVNTLWRENGRLCGDNTDVAGFLDNLDEEAPGWDDGAGTALVIGAGGAARAILKGLLSRGFERIALVIARSSAPIAWPRISAPPSTLIRSRNLNPCCETRISSSTQLPSG